MKHRAPPPPGLVRRATATVLDTARRGAAALPQPRHTARHAAPGRAHRPAGAAPRHAAAPDPRHPVGAVRLGVVATVATLGAIPVLSSAPGDAPDTAGADAGGTHAAQEPPGEAAADPAAAAAEAAAEAAAAQAEADARSRAAGRVSRQAERPKPTPKPTPKRPAWVHPMSGADLTSCYGQRWGMLHAGLDLAAPAGTAVRAVGAGRVVSAGWSYAGYGISVLVDHGNGYLTHYAHLSRASVRPGQRVAAGTVVGREGSTGDSTGPHLHFEVHKGLWRQVDPAAWLRARGVRSGC